MNICKLSFFNKQNSVHNNLNNEYCQQFKGKSCKPAAIFYIGPDKLSQVVTVSKHVQQLQLLYKAAGNYIGKLINNVAGFLSPVAESGIELKDILHSKDNESIKLKQDNKDKSSNAVLSYTFNRNQYGDILRISVLKNGKVEVRVCESFPAAELNKYLTEINENYAKLFETVLGKTTTAIDSIDSILKEGYGNEIDWTSVNQVQETVQRFVEGRKRATVLTTLVNNQSFARRCAENGVTLSNEFDLKDKDIKFYFFDADSQLFNGINIVKIDTQNGNKQCFVAMDDGHIYKTHVLPADKNIHTTAMYGDLTMLDDTELNSQELKDMFNYACAHMDMHFKYLLAEFYHGRHGKTESLDKFNATFKLVNKQVEKPFVAEWTKTIKNYNLNPELMEHIKTIEVFSRRISKAYKNYRNLESPEEIEANTGLIRKKAFTGFIIKDMALPDGMYIGISKYSSITKDNELLNFDIYDNNFQTVARLKVMDDSTVRLLVKTNAKDEYIKYMQNVVNNLLTIDFVKKMVSILDKACYYHENATLVKKTINHSYYKSTVAQTIDLMRGQEDGESFQVDNNKIEQLKANLENIFTICQDYKQQLCHWQNELPSSVDIGPKKSMRAVLDDLNINYDASFVHKKDISGLKIFILDNEGNIKLGYFIDNNGQPYKLLYLPKESRCSAYIQKSNLSGMNENAMAVEHLDLILEDLCGKMSAYNEYLQKCVQEYKLHPVKYVNQSEITSGIKHEIGQKKSVRSRKKSPYITPPVAGNMQHDETKGNVIKTQKSSNLPESISEPRTVVVEENSLTSPKVNEYTVPENIMPEIIEQYPNLLNQNGEFKPLGTISISDVSKCIGLIFAKPYEKRSPHLVHDLVPNSRVVIKNRFSVATPEGDWITVTQNKASTYCDFIYYSIRIQNGDKVMYLNIQDGNGRIFKANNNGAIIRNDKNVKQTIDVQSFIAANPLSVNMPRYFAEIFAYKPDAERKFIKFQKFNSLSK